MQTDCTKRNGCCLMGNCLIVDSVAVTKSLFMGMESTSMSLTVIICLGK